MKHKISYGMFAVCEGKVLVLQHRNGGHWSFSKGHPKRHETPIETASRELYEETGLHVKRLLLPYFLTQEYTYTNNVNITTKKRVDIIPVEVIHSHVQLQKQEMLDYKWVHPEELSDVLTYDEDRNLAAQMLQVLSS